MNPTFSIIIPSYNRGHLISKTIKSLVNQSYSEFECIVVDDGGKDNTREIIEAYNDHRIQYHYKKNEERAVARNYGIDLAKGDYITFLDSDDQLYPDHLREASALINRYGKPEWFHLGYEIRNGDKTEKKIISKTGRNPNESLLTGNHLSCMGVFIRKDIIRANRFNVNPDLIGSEDYELWLRLAQKYKLYTSDNITGAVIGHDNRSVLRMNKEKLINRVETLISIILNNPEINFTKQASRTFKAHRFAYLALHLAMIQEKALSLKYFFRSVALNPGILFHRKTFGFIKAALSQRLRSDYRQTLLCRQVRR